MLGEVPDALGAADPSLVKVDVMPEETAPQEMCIRDRYYPYLRLVVIKRLQSAHQNRFPPYREKLFGEFGPHAQALSLIHI